MSAPAPPPLRLLSVDDADITLDDLVVRPRQPGTMAIVVLALGFAGWSAWEAATGDLLWVLAALITVGLGTVAWLLFRIRQRTLRPGAWQMVIGRDRVLIRFRGVMESVPPGAPQIVELPLARVRSVRRLSRLVKDTGIYGYEYLDFRVRDCDLRPLQAVLLREQRDLADRWYARRDPGVVVTADNVLRVETSFRGSGVEPEPDALLRRLSEHVPLEENARERIDTTQPHLMLPRAQDDALRAIGETNVKRALLLARQMQPDAPQAALEARVTRLVTCVAPAPPAVAATPVATVESMVSMEPVASVEPVAPVPSSPRLSAPAPPAVLPPDPAVAHEGAAAPVEAGPPAPRILRRAEAELRPDDRLVRPSATFSLLLAAVCVGGAGWMGWKYWTGAMHWAWPALAGSALVLLGGGYFHGWRMSFRREAWLMAIGPDRILVSLRTYLHERLTADDPHILELPLAHIVSVRRTRLRRARPSARSRSGEEHSYFNFLDFQTRGMNLVPLGEAVAAEGDLLPDRSRAKVPVQVEDGGMVRVEISSIRGEDEVLRLLGERLPLEPEITEQVDTRGERLQRLVKPPPARA